MVGIVLVVDQLSKRLVLATIDRGERTNVFLGVDIVNVRNRGIAFGFLSDGGGIVVALTIAALIVLVGYFALHAERPLIWLPTGLLLGGALGNLIDRARDGAVVDFIDVPLWPAFNVADMAITFGVLALLYVLDGAARPSPRQ